MLSSVYTMYVCIHPILCAIAIPCVCIYCIYIFDRLNRRKVTAAAAANKERTRTGDRNGFAFGEVNFVELDGHIEQQ